MKAKLCSDWSNLRTGTITLTTDDGRDLATIVILAVSAKTINIRNYREEVLLLANDIIMAINRLPEQEKITWHRAIRKMVTRTIAKSAAMVGTSFRFVRNLIAN